MKRLLAIAALAVTLILGTASTASAVTFPTTAQRFWTGPNCGVAAWYHDSQTAFLQVVSPSNSCYSVKIRVAVEYKTCWCAAGQWFTAYSGWHGFQWPTQWSITYATAPHEVCPGGWCPATYAQIVIQAPGYAARTIWLYPSGYYVG